MRKLFRNMSFRAKLLTMLLSLTIGLSGFSLILVHSIEDVNQVSNKIKGKNIPELIWLSELEEELTIKEFIVKNYINNDRCCNLIETYQSYDSEGLDELEEDSVPGDMSDYKRRMDLLDFVIMNNVQGLLMYNDRKSAEDYINSKYLPQMEELKEDIIFAKKNSNAKLNGYSNRFSDIIENSLTLLILITSGAICFSIVVSFRISANLTKPVETMIDKVDRIANGRYGLTLNSTSQVELQYLTQSINQMSYRLKESFNTIMNDKVYREQILNSLPVGIITINDKTSDISLNTTAIKILNTNEDQVKKRLVFNDAIENKTFWDILTSKHTYLHTKVPFLTEEGQFFLLVSQTELLNQHKRVIGRIINFIDITETEELEKRMFQSEKLAVVGEMAAGAAHEIRNPLTVIHGFLTLMLQSISEQYKDQYHLPLVMKEIERINVIIEDMLLLSKPGAPIKKETYLEDIMGEILPLISQSSENVDFNIELDRNLLFVDTKQIKQVFHNLLRNSIESMSGNGTITIYTEVTEVYYKVYIKDSGGGIPASILKTLFEPFSSSKEHGTGLGLMIVRRIIENHKGRITLVDTSNEGTIFLIELPLTDAVKVGEKGGNKSSFLSLTEIK